MKVLLYPDKSLFTKCEPVVYFEDPILPSLLDQMKELMLASRGMGLAANQVGVHQRFFVMQASNGTFYEMINPVIISKHGLEKTMEGCLSTPKLFVPITRHKDIGVAYQDRTGKECIAVFGGIDARCVQHEIEHLDGKFYFERLSLRDQKKTLKLMEKMKDKL